MKAYKHLVAHALQKGATVSVWDGEAWQVKRSTKRAAIIEAIESVDEATLRFRDASGAVIGEALVSCAVDLEDDETVIDYTLTPFLESWENSVQA